MTTSRPYPSRPAALSGALFVVLTSAVLFAPGAPPKASDSAEQIASALVSGRNAILGGMYAAGLALAVGLVFFCTIGVWLYEAARPSDRALAIAGPAGAVVGALMLVGGILLFYGAAFQVAGTRELATVRGLTDTGNATIETSKFAFALFALLVAHCARRAGLLPRWFTVAGIAAAAAAVASAIPLFSEGTFTQFGGGLDLVGGAPVTLWMAALSVLLALRPAVSPLPAPRPS
jgi:hypothetical protein